MTDPAAPPPARTGRAVRAGLWCLPAYGVLLGLSTLTHQPDVDDFDAYARYVTTGVFLLSHLGASVFGAALAVLGAVAVAASLAGGRGARTAVAGLALTTVANVFLAAAFGSATFVQPGLGRAHLRGVPGMAGLNADTAYGPALVATALSASLLLVVAGVVLGTAVARRGAALRAPGAGYAVLLGAFVLSGFLLPAVQAYAGFALAAVGALIAVRLPRAVAPGAAPRHAGRRPVPAPRSA